MTNRDKLNQKNNEEFAVWVDNNFGIRCQMCVFNITENCGCNCIRGFKKWLDSEVENG